MGECKGGRSTPDKQFVCSQVSCALTERRALANLLRQCREGLDTLGKPDG